MKQLLTTLLWGCLSVAYGQSCTGPLTVTVAGSATGEPLTAAAETRGLLCADDPSGRATLTTTGGNGQYRYDWQGSAPDSAANYQLPAGNYSVLVSDSLKCSRRVDFTIDRVDPVLANYGLAEQDACGSCHLDDGGDTYFYSDTSYLAQIADRADNRALGNTTVCTFFDSPTQYCNGAPQLRRWWTVEAGDYRGQLRLFVTHAELNALARDGGYSDAHALLAAEELCLLKYSGGPADCADYGSAELFGQAVGDLQVYPWNEALGIYAVEVDVTGFAAFYLQVCGSTVAPSSLELFGEKQTAQIDLWYTSGEYPGAVDFEIERGRIPNQFEPWESRTGTSSSTGIYRLVDTDPHEGWNYYRVKRTHRSGTVSYSNVVAFEYYPQLGAEVLGNPVREEVRVRVSAAGSFRAAVYLVDDLGRRYQERTVQIRKGQQVLTADLTGFAESVYYSTLENLDAPDRLTVKFEKID